MMKFQDVVNYKIADRIKDIYLKNINILAPEMKQHFLSRLKICYPSLKTNDSIRNEMESVINNLKTFFDVFENEGFDETIDLITDEVVSNASPFTSNIKLNAKDYLIENKSSLKLSQTFCRITTIYNIMFRLKCDDLLEQEYHEKIQNFIKKYWEESLDISNDIFQHFPVQSINNFYYIKTLDFLNLFSEDKTDELEEKVLNQMFDVFKGDLDKLNFNRFLYALTHVIIGESWFYENGINKNKYINILNIFKNEEDRIFKDGSNDIITEIGVVWTICEEFEKTERYKKYVKSQLDKDGLVGSKYSLTKNVRISDKLAQLEHTNILAIMLLTNMSKNVNKQHS